MKKLLYVALVLLGIGLLASSCTKNDKNMLLGTWRIVSVVSDDSSFDPGIFLSGMTITFSDNYAVVSYGTASGSIQYEKADNYLIFHQDGMTTTWTILELSSTHLKVRTEEQVILFQKL